MLRFDWGIIMANDLPDAIRARTSRGRFMGQVGLAVFAAVPVINAMARPTAAAAGPDPPDCEYQECVDTGAGCCISDYFAGENATSPNTPLTISAIDSASGLPSATGPWHPHSA